MNETTLERVIAKVEEALPNGGWTLRRATSFSAGGRTWRAFTKFGMGAEEYEAVGVGDSPSVALLDFLAKVLDYEQMCSRQHEDAARTSRDRVARVQRAIEQP